MKKFVHVGFGNQKLARYNHETSTDTSAVSRNEFGCSSRTCRRENILDG